MKIELNLVLRPLNSYGYIGHPIGKGRSIHRKPNFECLWFFNVPRKYILNHGIALIKWTWLERGALSREPPLYHSGVTTEARTRDIRINSPMRINMPLQISKHNYNTYSPL